MEKKHNDPKTTGDELANVSPWGIDYSQLFPLMRNEPAPITGDTSVENREEEIVALRGWNLVVDSDSRYVLKSPGRGIVLWPKREPLKAECIPAPVRGRPDPYRGRPEPRPAHDAPGVGCWCGAYGLKDADFATTFSSFRFRMLPKIEFGGQVVDNYIVCEFHELRLS